MSFTGLIRPPGLTDAEVLGKELLPPDGEFLATETFDNAEFYAAMRISKTRVVGLVCVMLHFEDFFNFSYKESTEDEGPGPTRCPDHILDLLTPVEKLFLIPSERAERRRKNAQDWRDECRRFNAQQRDLEHILPGATVTLDGPMDFPDGATHQVLVYQSGNEFTVPGSPASIYEIDRWRELPLTFLNPTRPKTT